MKSNCSRPSDLHCAHYVVVLTACISIFPYTRSYTHIQAAARFLPKLSISTESNSCRICHFREENIRSRFCILSRDSCIEPTLLHFARLWFCIRSIEMDIAVSGDYNYSKRIIVSWVFMKYINVQEYYVAYYCKYNENRNSITNPSKVTIEVKTDTLSGEKSYFI